MERTIEDPVLGTLYGDEQDDAFGGELELDGEEVELLLRDWDGKGIDAALSFARDLVANWDSWRSRIEHVQERELLPLYNDNWRDESRPVISFHELRMALTPYAIHCKDNGWRSIFYHQDDLFTDHDVEMSISPEGEIMATLAG